MFDINVSMPDDFHVSVETTLNRGWTPEEVAHRCANKLMEVSENAPPDRDWETYINIKH